MIKNKTTILRKSYTPVSCSQYTYLNVLIRFFYLSIKFISTLQLHDFKSCVQWHEVYHVFVFIFLTWPYVKHSVDRCFRNFALATKLSHGQGPRSVEKIKLTMRFLSSSSTNYKNLQTLGNDRLFAGNTD